MAVAGPSLFVGISAVPDDRLASALHIIDPLWKSGDITVWRSGAGLIDLAPFLANALVTGRVWSAAMLGGVPEPVFRWIATRWPGSLVVHADSCDLVTSAEWSGATRQEYVDGLTLVVLRPGLESPDLPGGK